MNLFLTILLIISLLYAIFILSCLVGWRKLKPVDFSKRTAWKTSVSILIPARNEQASIGNCLNAVINQSYPHELTEIIVINDQSTDHTETEVRKIIQRIPERRIILLNTDEHAGSKKQAITKGIEQAQGDLIVTTDADCMMDRDWLGSLVSLYEEKNPSMIIAPVAYEFRNNFFEQWQALEFMGLVGIAGGAVAFRHPVLCNGANLAYRKKLFYDINGFKGNEKIVSGDDTDLLMKIAKKNPSEILFLKSRDAIVNTKAAFSLNDFIHQRKRWASKIPFTMDYFTRVIALIVYLLHAGLFAGIVLLAAGRNPGIIFIVSLALKSLSEFFFLYAITGFFRQRKLLWLILPAQLMYVFYISFIGIAALTGSYKWKERAIKKQLISG
jgi:cellulose synthase/poly-beta-1,6-N-acetylglucosamine synthase-like glycosyltransferase